MLGFDDDGFMLWPGDSIRESEFRIEKITLLNDYKQIADIDLSVCKDVFSEGTLCHFSLLIGVNGVGKSTILRGIIDFFIEFREYTDSLHSPLGRVYRRSTKRLLRVIGVKYLANGKVYNVWKNDNEKRFYVNNSDILDEDIPIPHIVASCFGVFDKFPIKNTMSMSTNRYNVPFYTYIGARASSNIFSVVNSIFQMLYYVLSLKKTETILKVKDVLAYMGYDDKVILACTLYKSDEIHSFYDMINIIEQSVKKETNSRKRWYMENFFRSEMEEQKSMYLTYQRLKMKADLEKRVAHFEIKFHHNHICDNKNDIRNLYQLKQMGFISQTSCFLYKKGKRINCMDISSGELNMFCTVIGALSASEKENALILIDEPEISQHPNWQMSIIDFLKEGLKDFPCHLLIATHSHFLVSDLPRRQSTVTYLNKTDEGLVTERIKEDTYGWSAEEVLLKVFKVSTTRNIYLAKIVGDMLDRIAKGDIDYQEVAYKVQFLKEVLGNMSDVDPMKKIITTIVNTFKHEK